MIYLDTAATYPRRNLFGNPSSAHLFGLNARRIIDDGRKTIAECMNCLPEEVYFTSGATEACNWAIYNLYKACGADNIIHPKVNTEHEAVRAAVEACAASGFFREPQCFTEEGGYYHGYYKMLANNETGDLYDMPKRKNVDDLIFTDATAAVGNIVVNFRALGVDYMAFSGHKFGGVMGAGCLLVRKGAPLYPMIVGGGQENGMRAGTENATAIFTMAEALKDRPNCVDPHTQQTKQKLALKMRFMNNLEPVDLCTPNFSENRGLYNIINLRFYGINGATLAMMLSHRGIMVSTGAACHSSQDASPSKVLKAIGLTDEEALSSIRISFDDSLTMEQCDKATKEIKECVEWLRKKGDVQ